MTKKSERTLSAQVILRPASGGGIPGDAAITAETLGKFRPSPESAKRARARLERAGFELGPLVGNSFSITASKAAFEKLLHRQIGDTAAGLEIAADSLPSDLADDVFAIAFTPPPDFGPTNY